MFQLESVSKRFASIAAVDNVSLALPQGQMIGIIGRSGAGKSTLLRLLNRLIDVSEGRIEFAGTDIGGLKGRALLEWRRRCAMIFQQFNLVGRLDVLTNVLIGRLNHHATMPSLLGLFDTEERAMAVRALERLDLLDQALQRAETLSGGQQQRVAIARALMQEPQVVLADEPIASLDPRNARLVMDALKAINREEGITVICNLHTLDTARTYCDRIVGMAAGRIVFDGTAAELSGAAVRAIYGVDGEGDAFSESITSTEIAPAPAAEPAVAMAL